LTHTIKEEYLTVDCEEEKKRKIMVDRINKLINVRCVSAKFYRMRRSVLTVHMLSSQTVLSSPVPGVN
jgi:hypothetical protein